MKKVNKRGLANHLKSVNFWSKIPWNLTNSEIVKIFKRPYTSVTIYRQIYAPETVKARKDWVKKIKDMRFNKLQYIVVNGFVQQASARVAGWRLGFNLLQKTRKDRTIQLRIKS